MCNSDRQLTSVNISSILANRNLFARLAYHRGAVSPAADRKVRINGHNNNQHLRVCRKKNLCGRVEVSNIPDHMNWQVHTHTLYACMLHTVLVIGCGDSAWFSWDCNKEHS